ncbi:MAG TPA: hypothetical protein VK335_08580 [Bryobacteraceae bacterium]|nr:hypothetical protein [Bryobacteraceae bacterium]HXR15964.1 hypothetical protein [Terriglobales bacterium]
MAQIVSRGVPALLSALLLIASGMECVAQPSGMAASGCCKHAPCKRSPGQVPHTSCEVRPASPQSLTLPASSGLTFRQVVVAVIEKVSLAGIPSMLMASYSRALPLQYSPPDLFLQNSSLLI